jgi:hypothetical protein
MQTLNARVSALELARPIASLRMPQSPEEMDAWILSIAQRDEPELTLETMNERKESARQKFLLDHDAEIKSDVRPPHVARSMPKNGEDYTAWFNAMELEDAWNEEHSLNKKEISL